MGDHNRALQIRRPVRLTDKRRSHCVRAPLAVGESAFEALGDEVERLFVIVSRKPLPSLGEEPFAFVAFVQLGSFAL